ncbi:hypothetical protein [Pararhizobium sp.]|uniref:hypothetical protein n=1 Tax=Pararhizobium sp. TaxID=1977563 RepID=UPI002721C2B8|nr:hypothetical protein [Pararhizobium sp.]MDO9417488.1 hypothetical protein [Pararhizobium sp.]
MRFTLVSMSMILAAASLVALPQAHANEIEQGLFGRDIAPEKNAYACFIRKYTKAHLASHPQQNVRDMALFVNSRPDEENQRQYQLTMRVGFRTIKQSFDAFGACYMGNDSTKKLHCGIDCDGGTINVRLKDEKSILLDIPTSARVSVVDDTDEPDDLPKGAKFGLDDKVFRLDRTDIATCLPLVADDAVKADIVAGQ